MRIRMTLIVPKRDRQARNLCEPPRVLVFTNIVMAQKWLLSTVHASLLYEPEYESYRRDVGFWKQYGTGNYYVVFEEAP